MSSFPFSTMDSRCLHHDCHYVPEPEPEPAHSVYSEDMEESDMESSDAESSRYSECPFDSPISSYGEREDIAEAIRNIKVFLINHTYCLSPPLTICFRMLLRGITPPKQVLRTLRSRTLRRYHAAYSYILKYVSSLLAANC